MGSPTGNGTWGMVGGVSKEEVVEEHHGVVLKRVVQLRVVRGIGQVQSIQVRVQRRHFVAPGAVLEVG